MSNEPNSKTIMIRVTPSVMQRVEAIGLRTGLKPATLARVYLLFGLNNPAAMALDAGSQNQPEADQRRSE